jgi:hypothetical protein
MSPVPFSGAVNAVGQSQGVERFGQASVIEVGRVSVTRSRLDWQTSDQTDNLEFAVAASEDADETFD